MNAKTIKRGAYPSPLNYHCYWESCCTSIKELVRNGTPNSTKLQAGDMINIDVTVYHQGYHGDCSEMFCVGEVDERGRELIQVTYDCWQAAAKYCQPGGTTKTSEA